MGMVHGAKHIRRNSFPIRSPTVGARNQKVPREQCCSPEPSEQKPLLLRNAHRARSSTLASCINLLKQNQDFALFSYQVSLPTKIPSYFYNTTTQPAGRKKTYKQKKQIPLLSFLSTLYPRKRTAGANGTARRARTTGEQHSQSRTELKWDS